MIKGVIHARELMIGEGIRAKKGRNLKPGDLGRISDGALIYSMKTRFGKLVPEKVIWAGPSSKIPKRYLKVPRKNLNGTGVLIPGLIDCHTHLVFAGNRADEFAERCRGVTYEQIAKRGGGILSTVRATREASEAELEWLALDRLKEASLRGVRTIEIKSGYGLDVASELKILKVIERLRRKRPDLTLVPTFLGAHAIPPEKGRELWVKELIAMLPLIQKKKLAQFCDIFIDPGYFTVEEGRALLQAAKKAGLQAKVHADELADTGASKLAVDCGALSADHLLKISDENLRKIARSNTVAVLLPGTAFFIKQPQAPARRLLDAGARVAIATDFNPGTCMSVNLPLMLTLGALQLGMNVAELFASVTLNAAAALGLEERKGTLEPGMDADFAVLPFESFEESYYRFGW